MNTIEDHTTSSDGLSNLAFTRQWSPKSKKATESSLVTTRRRKTEVRPSATIKSNAQDDVCKLFTYREIIEKRFDWLYSLQTNFLDEEIDEEDIALIFEKINNLVMNNKTVEVDEIIQHSVRWNLSYIYVSNILRFTFVNKDKIPKWDETLTCFIEKLKEDDLPAKEILIGIA
jgi:hypothetical protein